METELENRIAGEANEPRVWVLNLDAEYEMANLTMSASKRADVAKFSRAKFAFLGPRDEIVGRDTITEGLRGLAWCPTPRALRALERVGARLPQSPAFDVLRSVNHRGFAEHLGWPLPDTVLASSVDEAVRAVRRSGRWCAKRPLSAAGHGKRFIDAKGLSVADQHWLEASIRRQGSVLVEPRVQIELEFSTHGYIEPDGACRLGQPLAHHDREPIGARLSIEQRHAVVSEATLVSGALVGTGYFGPFGIDGYLGTLCEESIFVPRSEINARYTMNYPAEIVL